MQPYFDPTRKTTSKKMEDDLNKNKKNGRQPQQKNENGRQSNFFWKTRMTTSKKMEDDLK